MDPCFLPFPPGSVTVLTAPTNSGKSFFLKHLLEHLDLFFPRPVSKIVIVNSHHNIPFYPLASSSSSPDPVPPVEEVNLEDFHTDLLEENAILIFEDVQTLSPVIKEAIDVHAHHSNLAAVFVVTHELVGSPLFKFLNLVHRVVFFLISGSICRQADYIIEKFVKQGRDTNAYLKNVVQFVAREKETLLLEINAQAGNCQPHHLALSHLQSLGRDRGFCLLYPSLQKLASYLGPHFSPRQARAAVWPRVKANHLPKFFDMDRDYPEPSFVVLPVQAVVKQKAEMAAADNAETPRCVEQDKWEAVVQLIEEAIEFYFPQPKWKIAKGLAKEILQNPDFCVTEDGRQIHLRDKKNSTVSLMDFMAAVTRQAGPGEKANKPQWKKYPALIKRLRDRTAPDFLFRNKSLI